MTTDEMKRFAGRVVRDVLRAGAETAEVTLHVYGAVLSATEKSDDFGKSIDKAVRKLFLQLGKYKSKLRAKDKVKVRTIRQKP